MAVVVAVAEANGVDPLELEPLGDVIDPEALDRIFAETDDSRTNGWLTFRMAGCEVIVTSDGELAVTPETDAEPKAAVEDRWETTAGRPASPTPWTTGSPARERTMSSA